MMRKSFGVLLGVVFCACAGSEPTPTLTVTPSGTVQAAGPTLFTADPIALANEVKWSLAGPGSLSGTAGRTVVYHPPATPDVSATATLTATASGQVVTVQIHPVPAQMAPAVIAGLAGPVEVKYDAQQIPHIFCGNQLDCFRVQGYVHAQDRLFAMDFFRRTARGQQATLLGPQGVSSDQQFLTLFTTRDGKKIEDQLVANLDTQGKAVIDAYVSGINAYLTWLKAHPTFMPGEYTEISNGLTPNDIPPWTAADTLAFGRLIQLQLSESISTEINNGLLVLAFRGGFFFDPGKINAYFNARQPVRAYTLSDTDAGAPAPVAPPRSSVAPAPDLSRWSAALAAAGRSMSELRSTLGATGLGTGSNNWVVDAAHSATGHAMVANDPHLALYYPPLFHLSAMTASDGSGLDMIGASFPGVPGALSGRGAHVAWGVTTVGYDVSDVYLETLALCGGSPRQCGGVTFNSASVPMTVVPYTIKVRGSADVSFPLLVVPHHGPLLMDTYDPVNGGAISVRWTGQEVTRDLKAFYDLAFATSVGNISSAAGTAFAAVKNFAVGAQNFVLADDQGHIGFYPHAIVPKRSWAATNPPWLPLDGTGASGDLEWGSGVAGDNCAGTVTGGNLPAAACWVPDDQLPHGTDPAKGYYATANSDPIGATDDGNPFGQTSNTGGPYYPYLSFQWSDPTGMRYGRIASLLQQKTASGGKVSIADMQAIQGDHSLTFAKVLLPLLPAKADVADPQYGTALDRLTTWQGDGFDCPTGLTSADPNGAADTNPTHVRDSQACLLFHAFLRELLHQIFDDDVAAVNRLSDRPFSPDVGAEVRALFYMLDPATPASDTHFCNDYDVDGLVATHTCKEKVASSLIAAQAMLTRRLGPPASWIWGRQHTLTTRSPVSPLVTGGFAAGPFARPGGAETVDVGDPGAASDPTDFSYAHGSIIREIMDVTDPAHSAMKMQMPGPERDQPYGLFATTPYLVGEYVQNQYFDLLVGHQVDAHTVTTQGFSAQ